MTRDQVQIGMRYVVKVTGKLTIVVLLRPLAIGRGWRALNCYTGRRILIRSAQRLRRAVPPEEWANIMYKWVHQVISLKKPFRIKERHRVQKERR